MKQKRTLPPSPPPNSQNSALQLPLGKPSAGGSAASLDYVAGFDATMRDMLHEIGVPDVDEPCTSSAPDLPLATILLRSAQLERTSIQP